MILLFVEGSSPFNIDSHHLGPAFYGILWGDDVMGISELHGLQFDLIRHIHRLMLEQVSFYTWMTEIFQHQYEGG